MTAYTDFVKKRMAEMKSNPASVTEKMKIIAQEWRGGSKVPATKKATKVAREKATAKGKKGGALAGGALAGGAASEAPCACHKQRKGKGVASAAVSISSPIKGGSAVSHDETIYLDNGVPLHPDMTGAGFFSGSFKDVARDIWTGIKMPFQAIGKVVTSPLGRTALAVAPLLL